MPEVIDLISSSPPQVAGKQISSKSTVHNALEEIFDSGLKSLDIGLDFERDSAKRSKRQKTTHSPRLPGNQGLRWPTTISDAVFDLSSDQDLLPCAKGPSQSALMGFSSKVAPVTDEQDFFHFSSSAPEPLQRSSPQRVTILDLSSDLDLAQHDPIQTSSQPVETSRSVFSQTTANLLANLRTNSSRPQPLSGKGSTSGRYRRAASAEESRPARFKRTVPSRTEDILDSSQDVRPQLAKKPTIDGKQTKSSAQQLSKEQREAAKEAEKQRKKQEKEERQKEKQKAADIAEVNKSKTNKKNSTPEMILDMPTTLRGYSLCNQVEEYMKELGVQLTFNDTAQHFEPEAKIIRWRRKVVAEYDDDHEIWKPLAQPQVSNEAHIIVYMKAEDFVNIAVTDDGADITTAADISEEAMKSHLDKHITSIRSKYGTCRLIYLIEGLSTWLKRSVNAKNRAYTAAVRAQTIDTADVGNETGEGDEDGTNSIPPSTQRRKPKATSTRRKKTTDTVQTDLSSITESTTETLLLHMQIHHQPLVIHHTTSPKTSAAQISAFTQHLSTRPYRLAAQNANLVSASFCMTTGQIRTGITAAETWTQMLQEINRVTPSMACGIAGAGYTNPTELVKQFRKEGRLMLEDVRKATNKDGGWSDRRLGPMVSKRVYKVFMGKDPTAMDGMA